MRGQYPKQMCSHSRQRDFAQWPIQINFIVLILKIHSCQKIFQTRSVKRNRNTSIKELNFVVSSSTEHISPLVSSIFHTILETKSTVHGVTSTSPKEVQMYPPLPGKSPNTLMRRCVCAVQTYNWTGMPSSSTQGIWERVTACRLRRRLPR